MREKRDQLQAHLFMVARLVKAMVAGEPDLHRTPLRRTSTGWYLGGVLAVVFAIGYGVVGLISPGSSGTWKSDGSVVVDRGTGARYVMSGGELRPVSNYASALLVSGRGNTQASVVSARALRKVPHGPALGIPGAPDSLPTADVLHRRWTMCVREARTGGQRLRLSIPGPRPTAPGQDSALLSQTGGDQHLLWHGRRYRLATPAASVAMGVGGARPLELPRTVLDAIPAGDDLTTISVPGLGRTGPVVDAQQTKVGQVLRASAGGDSESYYLVLSDGLLRLPETEALMALNDPENAEVYRGRPRTIDVSGAGVAAAPSSRAQSAAGDWPARPPLVMGAGQTVGAQVCVGLDPRVGRTASVQVGLLPATSRAPRSAGTDVRVASGEGAFVVARGVKPPTAYLVTDDGRRYEVPSDEALSSLGLGGARVASVPAGLLALLPQGPRLDPEVAARGPAAVAPSAGPSATTPNPSVPTGGP